MYFGSTLYKKISIYKDCATFSDYSIKPPNLTQTVLLYNRGLPKGRTSPTKFNIYIITK